MLPLFVRVLELDVARLFPKWLHILVPTTMLEQVEWWRGHIEMTHDDR